MRHKTLLSLLLLFILVFGVASIVKFANPAAADSNGNISGYAWDSNMGWISFKGDTANGGKYAANFVRDLSDPGGVKGTFSHDSYAWSSNAGWINFSSDYSGSYPIADTDIASHHGVRVESDGSVTGWARACSVFVNNCSGETRSLSETGGWDGWIKMSGDWDGNGTIDPVVDNFVRLVGNEFKGYAWGASNLGWISFCDASNVYCVKLDSLNPVCSGTPSPAELSGNTVNVTWNAIEPLPLSNYDFSWTWSSDFPNPPGSPDGSALTPDIGPSVSNTYTVPQRITGILAATGKTGTTDAGKTGTATCSVNVTNPNQKTVEIEFTGVRASSGNVSDGIPGGLNCLNGISCSKTYNIGDTITLNASVTSGAELPPLNAMFQGWSAIWNGGSCSGTGSCNVTITALMDSLTIINASFTDFTAPPSSGTITVFPPWTRILEQNAGSPANSSLVKVTVNNTGTSDINVCLASVKSKVNTDSVTGTLDYIVEHAKRAVGDPRNSNDLPKCTFGSNQQGGCSDNCVNGIPPSLGTPTVLSFFITIPEKFYEIKANSPYDVKIEARDGINSVFSITPTPPGLEFRYEVRDVVPR